jgi:hypothetical protein
MTNQEILEQVSAGKLDPTEAAALLAAVSATRGNLTLKVSEKGAVSMYGLRRFPITFYKDEWARILSQADIISVFIADNASSLTSKSKG